MHRKLIVAIFGAIACIVNIAIVALMTSPRGPAALLGGDEIVAGERQRETAVETHRRRARETIRVIQKESNDEIVLNLVGDAHVFYPGIQNNQFNPQLFWEFTLSSRRVWRLNEVLGKQSADERARLIDRAFNNAMQLHEAAFRRVYEKCKDPKAPDNKQSLLATRIGLCSSLFLTARHQDPQDVVKKLAELQKLITKIRDLFADVSDSFPASVALKEMLAPDDTFYVNLVLYLIPDAERRAVLEQLGAEKLFRNRMIEVTRWDAEPGSYDFAHTHLREPYSSDDVVASIWTYEWTGASVSGSDVQKEITSHLLNLLSQRFGDAKALKAKDR